MSKESRKKAARKAKKGAKDARKDKLIAQLEALAARVYPGTPLTRG